jgi:hypothetical protein
VGAQLGALLPFYLGPFGGGWPEIEWNLINLASFDATAFPGFNPQLSKVEPTAVIDVFTIQF